MAQDSTFWNVGAGDDGPYPAEQFADFVSFIFQHDKTVEAPIKYALNELAITYTAPTTINVATGKAIVAGTFYINSSIKTFAVVVPGAGDTNYYTLVLQKDITAQEVRLAMFGPSTILYPTVTQDATTWEVEIAQIEVTDAGAVTITDARVFCAIPMEVISSAIAPQAITKEKIKLNEIDYTILDTDLYPYTTKGEIAVKGSALGTLDVIAQGNVGDILQYIHVGTKPSFRPSFDGCGLTSLVNQTIAPGDPYLRDVTLGTVLWDTNPWGTAYSVTPNRITIPSNITDGNIYMVSAGVSFDYSAYGYRMIDLYIDMLSSYEYALTEILSGDTAGIWLSLTGLAKMYPNWVLKLRVSHNLAVPVIINHCYLSIMNIGQGQ